MFNYIGSVMVRFQRVVFFKANFQIPLCLNSMELPQEHLSLHATLHCSRCACFS